MNRYIVYPPSIQRLPPAPSASFSLSDRNGILSVTDALDTYNNVIVRRAEEGLAARDRRDVSESPKKWRRRVVGNGGNDDERA